MKEAEEYRRQAEGFSSAVEQHVDRPQAVHVFSQEAAHAEQYPLCDSRLETPTPSVAALTTSLTRMQANMTGVQRERPQLEQYMNG